MYGHLETIEAIFRVTVFQWYVVCSCLCVAARKPSGPVFGHRVTCQCRQSQYPNCLYYQKGHQRFLLYFLQVLGFFYWKCAVETAKQTLNCPSQDLPLLVDVAHRRQQSLCLCGCSRDVLGGGRELRGMKSIQLFLFFL